MEDNEGKVLNTQQVHSHKHVPQGEQTPVFSLCLPARQGTWSVPVHLGWTHSRNRASQKLGHFLNKVPVGGLWSKGDQKANQDRGK